MKMKLNRGKNKNSRLLSGAAPSQHVSGHMQDSESIFSKECFPGKITNCVLAYSVKTDERYVNWLIQSIQEGDASVEPIVTVSSSLSRTEVSIPSVDPQEGLASIPADYTGDETAEGISSMHESSALDEEVTVL